MQKGLTAFDYVRDRLTSIGFDSPATLVAWTLCLGTGIRLLLAVSVVDLGHSEAYYIAASRHFALSYFDHPPLSFWIAWATMKVTGSDAVLVVRTPFILLFIGTTWVMFRLTAFLFGETAGAFAALLLNISPMFTLSLGAWVQPDGPLILCVLAATYCIARLAYATHQKYPYLLWAQAGFWLGLALLSKYYAAMLPVGVMIFAFTSRDYRRWFREPGPYIACAIAMLFFSPVLIWNWQNDWISFVFLGERVVENRLALAVGQHSGAGGADRSVDLDPDAARRRTRRARWPRKLQELALLVHRMRSDRVVYVRRALGADWRPLSLAGTRISYVVSSARQDARAKAGERQYSRDALVVRVDHSDFSDHRCLLDRSRDRLGPPAAWSLVPSRERSHTKGARMEGAAFCRGNTRVARKDEVVRGHLASKGDRQD